VTSDPSLLRNIIAFFLSGSSEPVWKALLWVSAENKLLVFDWDFLLNNSNFLADGGAGRNKPSFLESDFWSKKPGLLEG